LTLRFTTRLLRTRGRLAALTLVLVPGLTRAQRAPVTLTVEIVPNAATKHAKDNSNVVVWLTSTDASVPSRRVSIEGTNGAGVRWTDARPNHGQSIEDVVERTWKSKEIAPPIATPHIGGPLGVWVSCLQSLRPVLSDLAKQLETLDLEAIVYPHYLSGPLDGRQRLEFLRYHMERHLAQIQRVKAHPQFPA